MVLQKLLKVPGPEQTHAVDETTEELTVMLVAIGLELIEKVKLSA